MADEEKAKARERMLAGKAIEPSGQLTLGSEKGQSRDFIARKAGFSSEASYRRSKRVVEQAIPEVVEKLDLGNITAYRAADMKNPPRGRVISE